jgi:putative ABC transport system permease protein
MLKNYIKIALRTVLRQKGYSVINITGLAVGIACCLLIFMYVKDDLSYDRFHENSDRIYRVYRTHQASGGDQRAVARTNYLLSDILTAQFPDIEKAVRIARSNARIRYNEQDFIEPYFFIADPGVFDVFTIPYVQGDPVTALSEPFSVVVTEETAQKYFGDENPIGKTLLYDYKHPFTVTGVVRSFPTQSHFHFDFIASLESTKSMFPPVMFEHWGNIWLYTYLLLSPGTEAASLERRFAAFMELHAPDAVRMVNLQFHLQPVTDIHLRSHLDLELEANSNLTYIYIFTIIALFILAIACFNFINLTIARSARRRKEVGIRKTIGANRPQLIRQFIGESVLITAAAVVIGLLIIELILPVFNDFTGKALSTSTFVNGAVLAGLLGIILIVGFGAGIYPALFFSSYRPVEVISGKSSSKGARNHAVLRKGIVTVQFAISITLIASTVIIYNQLTYLRTKDLGFDKDQIMIVELNDPGSRQQVEVLKESFETHSSVLQAAAASHVPPQQLSSWRIRPVTEPSEKIELINVIAVDYDFIELMGIDIVEGRNLSREYALDDREGIIFNEAAVKYFDLDDPVGVRFDLFQGLKNGTVVGVVDNFHYESLHSEVMPVFLHIWPQWYSQILLKTRPENIPQTVQDIREIWLSHIPDWPFEYRFLDEDFDLVYRSEQRFGQLILYFSILAIFIACLGLFGLASYATQQRTKEIGVRKVLGASIAGIVALLSKEFLKLVVIANVIAWPITYIAVNRWLENFEYRIHPGWTFFIMSGAIAILIALLTLSYQAVRAAMANPVESLRYE